MRTRTIAGAATLALLALGLTASPGQAQEQTERFIPIGRSPGVSGVSAYLGEIVAVDPATLTMTVRAPEGSRQIRLNERTRIWLDRTSQRQMNLTGGYEDCEVGRTVEVKFVDPERMEVADWVKVRIPGSG